MRDAFELPQLPAGHYLDGLNGCGKQGTAAVRRAFEGLYSTLSRELETACHQEDAVLLLSLMDAVGMLIHEVSKWTHSTCFSSASSASNCQIDRHLQVHYSLPSL
jgi:hypothetical protein